MYGNLQLRDGRVEFRWKRWRNKKRQEVSCCLMVLLSGMVLLGGGGIAEAGPTGGQITGGTGSINYGGTTTTINQKSQVITINWQTFSTARNETVDFNQPGNSSLAINYVVGGVPSVLQGALNADGRVYILNSAGITFTGTSHVNVGALLATTAMTIDGDPTKKIDVKGSGSGQVINQGSIQVSNGGFAILAAPYVENTGFIKADLGTIALAGTNKFTLDLRGDGLINFVVPPEAVEKIKSDGTRVGVNNTGTLQARSGQVLISASVATQVVNAAVNMSGVVDASAFAPNGKGGSVLITSEGDINLTGQVNAAGAGTGAGGEIITKAVGADNINRKAVMTAAGGNGGGQGGQIEVSGHDMLLSGNIDPGAGGTLIVDPYNAIITPTKGFNDIAGSTISEAFISKQLKHNVSVDIQASHDIVFAAAGNNHVLVGGNGNLTLDAANDILFSANDYAIETKAGAVNLTAGGDIGAPDHRLSLTSSKSDPGIDAAGNILLTAGDDIYVGTITSKAGSKGHARALFSANAGGTFSAAGLIDVEAVTKGKGSQQASAGVKITAGNDLILHGLTDLASVQSRGKGSNLVAVADVDLTGHDVTDTGNMTVLASVAGRTAHAASANADLILQAASDLRIDGNLALAAAADLSKADSIAAHGLTNLGAGNSMTVNGAIDVEALASDRGLGNVTASALFDIPGSQPFPAGSLNLGPLTDRASAHVGGGAARSLAGVTIQTPSVIRIAGPVDVSAGADNSGNGAAAADGIAASANGDLTLSAGNVSVGNISVIAHGTNSGAGGVGAGGRLHATGQSGSGLGGVSLGDVLIDVTALNEGEGGAGGALADASLNAAGFGAALTVSGVNIQALADSQGTGGAHAAAIAALREGGPVPTTPQVFVAGGIAVDAAAITGPDARANASALASLAMAAGGSGGGVSLTVQGPVAIGAAASDRGAGNAVASALGHFRASGEGAALDLGSLSDVASALNWGGGSVRARADVAAVDASIPPGAIDIAGNVVLLAHAHNFSGAPQGSGAIGASANAELDFGGGGGLAVVTVDGDISITAQGTNDAAGEVKSRAAIDFSRVSSIDLGDVLIDAAAVGEGGALAVASALANIPAAGNSGFGIPGNLTMGALTDRASAINFGGGSAKALANVNAQAVGQLDLAGDVQVSANALIIGGAGSTGAASANAALALLSGGNIMIDGNVGVAAHAAGASVNLADANVVILANQTTGSIFINGRLTDLATASAASDHAIAMLKMNAHSITSGGELGLGDPVVRARAGNAVAEWLIDSSGTAASDGAFVRVNIPPGF